MALFEQGVGFGLIEASIIAIASVGFTMQFGIANMLNLAFTQVMSLAGFVAYVALSDSVNLWLSLVVGAAAGAGASLIISKLLYDPFRRRGAKPFTLVFVSLGLGLVMENAILATVGPSYFTYPVGLGKEDIHVLNARFSGDEVIIMGIALGLMIALHLLLRFTQLGRAMRAMSANRDLARSAGIPATRMESLVWVVSGALAGIAGVVLFLNVSTFTPATTTSFLVVVIAAAVLGGVGEVYGAMLAALIVGEAVGITSLWIPSYSTVSAFAILVIVLLVRPEGVRGIFSLSREATPPKSRGVMRLILPRGESRRQPPPVRSQA